MCHAHGRSVPLYRRDKPEDLGFPPVEPVEVAKKPAPGAAAVDAPAKPSIMQTLLDTVLRNPFIWGMALTYFFIYVVRQVRAGGRRSFGRGAEERLGPGQYAPGPGSLCVRVVCVRACVCVGGGQCMLC